MTNKEIAERIINNTCKNRVFCELYPDACQKEKCDIYLVINTFLNTPDTDTPSRQRGEWVRLEREENVYDLHGVPTWGVNYMCDKCGFITTAIQDHFAQYRWCPSCGARMYKGGEEE